MSADWIDEGTAAVQRWMGYGRSVLIRGDRGSGRSSILAGLMRPAVSMGSWRLLLQPAGQRPLAALLAHSSTRDVRRAAGVVSEHDLVSWLRKELEAPHSVLLIDDLEQIDEASLSVVRRTVESTGAVVVATAGTGVDRGQSPGLAALLAELSPAEVHLEPLAADQMHQLLMRRLGGPLDLRLVVAVSSWSAGNPRAAVAVVDSALYAGAIIEGPSGWTLAGALEQVPMDAVVHGLVSDADATAMTALEFVAWRGTVDAAAAEPLLGRETLDQLADEGRLMARTRPDGSTVLWVTPPALAVGLRQRLSRVREHRFSRWLADVPQLAVTDDPLPETLAAVGPSSEPRRLGPGALTAFVVEQSRRRREQAVDAWRVSRDLGRATELLRLLGTGSTVTERQVMAGTQFCEGDDPAQLAEFTARLHEAAYQAGVPVSEFAPGAPQAAREDSPLIRVRPEVIAQIAAGDSTAALTGTDTDPGADAYTRAWSRVLRAGALVEVGRADLAGEVAAEEVGPDAPCAVRVRLHAIRGLSLLYDRMDEEAEDWIRRGLRCAEDAVDADAVQVLNVVLAEVLLLTGREDEAWSALSTALQCGAPREVDNSFYRRGVSLSIVLRLQAGDALMLPALESELDRAAPARLSVVGDLAAVARAALMSARQLGCESYLWQAGVEAEAAGWSYTAALCWLCAPGPYDKTRIARVRSVVSRLRGHRLDGWLQLHEAMAADDEAATMTVLAELPLVPLPVVDRLVGLWRGRELPTPVKRLLQSRDRARVHEMVGTLSNRELEVARMAVSGLSNKQIADALFLSIRTVENHMSRALQKLGCANRGELGAVLGLASREPSPPPTPAPPPTGTPTGEAAQAAARAASVPTPRESREDRSAPV